MFTGAWSFEEKKKQGTPKNIASKNLPILNHNKKTNTAKQNTSNKRLSAILRKSPRLKPVEIPMEMLNDLLKGKKSGNPKHQGTKKHLNFESAEYAL